MAIFEEIVLTWKGKNYKIPPDEVMGAIARIESVITLKEISDYAQRNDAPMGKMAMAYGAVLRYAGAKARDDEVYAAMFSGEEGEAVQNAIQSLLMMMIPPDQEEKKAPKKKSGAGAKSSKNASK